MMNQQQPSDEKIVRSTASDPELEDMFRTFIASFGDSGPLVLSPELRGKLEANLKLEQQKYAAFPKEVMMKT